ncbi:flagellar biosynthesis chaperone FliJ [Xanthomonas campestris]
MGISAENAQESMDELAGLLPEYPSLIHGKLTTNSARLKSLLAKASIKSVDLKKGASTFKCSEPILIRGVRFYSPDPDKAVRLINMRAIKVDGSMGARKRGFRPKGMDYSFVPLDAYCTGFEVEINISRSVVAVTKIEVVGYNVQQLEDFAETLQKGLDVRHGLDDFIEGYRAEFVDITNELSIAKEALEKSNRESTEVNAEVTSVKSDLAALEIRRSGVTSEMEKLAEANRAAENAKEQLESELKVLNSSMGETRFKLKELINEKRLISDEYSDFVTEGRGQSTIYVWLSVLPVIGALGVLGFLLNAGWNFADIAVSTPSEAYAHLLQRAPYTLATVAAFSLLVKVAYMLITKVIQIHEDRLTLAKLLVIARDTVVASAADLEMSDEEIFNQRIQLKMKLLKQYLNMEDDVESDKQGVVDKMIEVAKDVVEKHPVLKKGSSP